MGPLGYGHECQDIRIASLLAMRRLASLTPRINGHLAREQNAQNAQKPRTPTKLPEPKKKKSGVVIRIRGSQKPCMSGGHKNSYLKCITMSAAREALTGER